MDVQSSRLDPHASKCRGTGRLSGRVLPEPHARRDCTTTRTTPSRSGVPAPWPSRCWSLALVAGAAAAACDDGVGAPADDGAGARRAAATATTGHRAAARPRPRPRRRGDRQARPRPRRTLEKAIAEVVDGWLDAAYVAGDYPRTRLRDAFPGFTRGAADRAAAGRALMSNQAIGARIDAVDGRPSAGCASTCWPSRARRPVAATARARARLRRPAATSSAAMRGHAAGSS